MTRLIALLCSRRGPTVAGLALMSVSFAGCSADTARFADNPFSSNSQPPAATGSVAAAPSYGRVERQPLPPQPQYQTSGAPPAVAPVQSYPVASASRVRPADATGAVRSAPRANGTRIIVGTSDTLDILSRRYNVPVSAILQANHMRGTRVLSPGQSLIIPHRTAAPAPKAVARASSGASRSYTVAAGDTLFSVARRHHVSVSELARTNKLTTSAMLKIGDRLTVPGKAGAQHVAAAPKPAAKPKVAEAPAIAKPASREAASAPAEKAALAASNDQPQIASKETTSGLPSFRWPAKGRVIVGYGAKTNGKSNDGINLSLPEGTPVKAADDGVVAYSGNELKGYGNLVLVRHPSGYVTAYAHASELMVKRGDTIKRGQIIAKSGQTGEVKSPQLHFEIRKGATPVDPMRFLGGA